MGAPEDRWEKALQGPQLMIVYEARQPVALVFNSKRYWRRERQRRLEQMPVVEDLSVS